MTIREKWKEAKQLADLLGWKLIGRGWKHKEFVFRAERGEFCYREQYLTPKEINTILSLIKNGGKNG